MQRWTVCLSILGLCLSSCAAAVAGTAGAIGAIAYTNRGVKSEVRGSVAEVSNRARDVLQSKGFTLTGSSVSKSGAEQELKGRKGDMTVTVEMKRSSADVTHVEIIAQSGTLQWDKDYAKELMGALVSE